MTRRCSPPRARLALGLLLSACQPTQPEVTAVSTGSETTGSGSTAASTSDSIASTTTTSSTSGETGSQSTSVADSSGTESGTTLALDSSGSSSESSTGEPSPVGCADGVRDALIDQGTYPDIAACAGGFWIPGVHLDTPVCDRQGGDDGSLPDGMGCSIDDLCAAGWHLCTSSAQVMMAGIDDCGRETWENQFFATAQSGQGANTCGLTGTNDVFGCGDVGYATIHDCDPLNRSTSNLCEDLAGPWECAGDPNDEVSTLAKPGPDFGGALCCRDGI